MPRKPRHDKAGLLYHVMNRGVARRSIFESRSDRRFFLALVARAVRRGEIDVHAFVLMQTHFHLLVRSHGRMSEAMRRIQMRYTLRFNRVHGRSGPLVGGRFHSKPVRSHRYRRTVLRYIHENPVLAGMCCAPEAHPWSSAALVHRAKPPLWFSPETMERYSAPDQASTEEMRARAELAMHTLTHGASEVDEPGIGATPAAVTEWLDRRARLADGRSTTNPVVGPRTLQLVAEKWLRSHGRRRILVPGGGAYPTRELLLAGLLRDASGCGFAQIAEILGQSGTRAQRLVRLHRRCVRGVDEYAVAATQIIAKCLAMVDGPGQTPGTDESRSGG